MARIRAYAELGISADRRHGPDYVMGAGKACREEMTQALAELRAIRPSPELMAMCLPSESQWRDMGDRIAIGMLHNCVVEQLGGERKHGGYATEHHL